MSMCGVARVLSRIGLSGVVILVAYGATAPSINDPAVAGACYCRAAGSLSCLGVLTKPECDKQCTEAFCDEWFWLERRPCWNWGYGG
jgi:hypothetical protein